jgi:hypothetical protein
MKVMKPPTITPANAIMKVMYHGVPKEIEIIFYSSSFPEPPPALSPGLFLARLQG